LKGKLKGNLTGKLTEKTDRETVIAALPEIHELLLGMILMVDRICRKHGIRYFLGGGTLLGAVRNGGFIPWDNDADLMLLRPDYDRLLKILPAELPPGVFMESCETDRNSHQPFLKLRLDGTVYATEFTAKHPELHNGFFIDILAQDVTGASKLMRKMHIFETMLVRSMVFHKWDGSPVHRRRGEKGNRGGNRRHLRPDELVCTGLKNILPQRLLDRWMLRLLVRYRGKHTGWLYDGMGRNIGRGAFPEKWLKETVYLPFEGYQLPVPKEYKRYLRYLYGDYRKLPPAEKRVLAHEIPYFSLGKYADYRVSLDPERRLSLPDKHAT